MADEVPDKNTVNDTNEVSEFLTLPPHMIDDLSALVELAENLKQDMQRIIDLKKRGNSQPKEQNMLTLSFSQKSDHSSLDFNKQKIALLKSYVDLTTQLAVHFTKGTASKERVTQYLSQIVEIESKNRVINDRANSSNTSGPIVDLINHTYDKASQILNYEPPKDSKEPSNPNQ